MDLSALVDNVMTYMSRYPALLRAVLNTTTATVAFFFGFALGILGVYRYITKPIQSSKALPSPKTDPNDIAALRPPSRRHVLPTSGKFKGTLTGDISVTGIGLLEIRQIAGTYPDYAVLSGVPHPQPCPPGFVLEKARFRPFRPFRWRYHQHMGRSQTERRNLREHTADCQP